MDIERSQERKRREKDLNDEARIIVGWEEKERGRWRKCEEGRGIEKR